MINLQHFLDAIIFNFLVGNNNAHGKNFSLIYQERTSPTGASTRLAPLYDVLSTAYYPELSKKMAMKIGSEYESDGIRPKHFEQLAEEAGLSKPMMKRRVPELAEIILSRLPQFTTEHPVTNSVAKLIQSRCQRAVKEFKG